jgi:hypothetical protein
MLECVMEMERSRFFVSLPIPSYKVVRRTSSQLATILLQVTAPTATEADLAQPTINLAEICLCDMKIVLPTKD